MSDLFNEQKGQVQEYTKSKGTFQVGFYENYSSNITKIFDNWDHFF